MQCSACGTQLPDNSKFCDICGKAVGTSSNFSPQKNTFWYHDRGFLAFLSLIVVGILLVPCCFVGVTFGGLAMINYIIPTPARSIVKIPLINTPVVPVDTGEPIKKEAVIPNSPLPVPSLDNIPNSSLPDQSLNVAILQPTTVTVPTLTPTPIPDSPIGTFKNPVSIGAGYTFPGLGTLTVVKSSWLPGQTGFANVELSFRCERPSDQECDTGDFMLDALGGSGNGYDRGFDSAIPDPSFGNSSTVYGGGVETGYAGFLIKNNESSLVMRVHLFLDDGYFFFKISN